MKIQAFESLSPITGMTKKDLVALAKEIASESNDSNAIAFYEKVYFLIKEIKHELGRIQNKV